MNEVLTSAFSAESVALLQRAESWRDAIVLAGGALEAAGFTKPEYTRAMIEVVETNGPYIVIAPGLALAHARPSDAVLQSGLSLVTLETPVVFGSVNDPVSVVVGLAATDKEQHVLVLQALAQRIMNQDFVNSLLKLSNFGEFLNFLSD